MLITRRRMLLAVLLAPLLFTGCRKIQIAEPDVPSRKNYSRQLPPGAPALRKITDPSKIPDFRSAFTSDHDSLLRAIDNSIRYLSYPSSQRYYPIQEITHARAAASLIAFKEILTSAHSSEELQQRIVESFDVYESVGCDDLGTVQFTGYYTPIFEASLTPNSEYRFPLYSLPEDLVKGPEGDCLGRRLDDGSIVPYYTRAEIDNGALAGNELVYLKDRFAAYICTVQGSARLRLNDGSWFNIGYAGNNGYDYVSVNQLLVKDRQIPADQMTLSTMIAFFGQNPAKMDEYLNKNPRYVFFQPTDSDPTGSLGVPVTTRRSIATDKSLFPRGALAFVDTLVPNAIGGSIQQEPFRQFVLDQDTGGAIRAAGRCDIYLGIGDEAGRIAGYTMNEGGLYYLFLK